MPASARWVPCAPWFGIQAVSRPSVHTAAPARTSSGATATRWLSTSWLTTTSQSAKMSRSGASFGELAKQTFVPTSGNSTVSSRSASFGIDDRGQRLVLDVDELGGVLALVALVR